MFKKEKRVLFFNEIRKYFNKNGYRVEWGAPLDLIIKKDGLTIPVEIKCRTKRVKNDKIFIVQFTMNQLKKSGILLLVDDGHKFYEFKSV